MATHIASQLHVNSQAFDVESSCELFSSFIPAGRLQQLLGNKLTPPDTDRWKKKVGSCIVPAKPVIHNWVSFYMYYSV